MSKKIHRDEDIAEFRAIFGPRLQSARKALGITQTDAARKIGISPEFYARMERGHTLPSVTTLAKIVDKLNISVDYLFGITTVSEPMPATAVKDRPEITYIVKQARGNPELTRVLLSLLKLCAKLGEPKPTGP